jgi:hypothetical protein
MMADPGMTRPITVTVQNDTGTSFTAGGIHYGLTRVDPNIRRRLDQNPGRSCCFAQDAFDQHERSSLYLDIQLNP